MTKSLKIIILILIIILSGIFIFFSSFRSKSPPTSPLTDAERQDIMNRPSGLPIQNPNITDADRASIMNQPLKNN